MPTKTPKVDGFIRKNKAWREELETLRAIVLDCGLTEEVKWRVPCYTADGRNIVLLGAYKEACVISFVNGALLKDTKRILSKPGENSQAARVIRFANVQEIVKLEPTLKAYIKQAIKAEKAGLKVQLKDISEREVPEELQTKLDKMPALNKAFNALTPGRRRAYFLHIAGAKQSKTRASRVEKCIPRILDGKGLND
ncbi:MAG: YdeI/OmpD-associated family protein [Phycisphaerales bacterium]